MMPLKFLKKLTLWLDCAPTSEANCALCSQVENECGPRKIYFRVSYYTKLQVRS